MPSLNFTMFVDQIEDGRITQAFRPARVRAIKTGDRLHLFTNMNRPECRRLSPPNGAECCYACSVKVQSYITGFKILLDETTVKREQALSIIRNTGFDSPEAFYKHFIPDSYTPFEGQLIRWKWWSIPGETTIHVERSV